MPTLTSITPNTGLPESYVTLNGYNLNVRLILFMLYERVLKIMRNSN
jgi:hypothetical protein